MIGYFRGKSFVSKCIRWRTWGSFSHVAWIVERDIWIQLAPGKKLFVPRGTIYESWHRKAKGAKRNGARKGIAGDLHKPGTLVDLYKVNLSKKQEEKLIIALELWARDPKAKYALRAVLVGFSLRKNSAHNKHHIFCSDLLMHAFIAANFRFLINIKPFKTSPVDMSHSPKQHFIGQWKTATALPSAARKGEKSFTPKSPKEYGR